MATGATYSLCPQGSSQAELRVPKSSLTELLQLKKFDEVLFILDDKGIDFCAWFRESGNNPRGQTALHIALQHDPPVALVRMMLCRARQASSGNDPVLSQDTGGRTALHVAVARSSPVNIVELFLCGANAIRNHNPAAVLDCQDRFPLHWACANLAKLKRSKRNSSDVENMVRVIDCLVAACPMAVESPDAMGLTPRAMARDASATVKTDRRILRRLDSGEKLYHLQKQQEQLCQQQEKQQELEINTNVDDDDDDDDDDDNDDEDDDDDDKHILHKEAKEEIVNCGGSRNTEPTAASSTDQRPIDVLNNSIGWDDDMAIFQRMMNESKRDRLIRKLVRSDSVRLDL